MALENLMLGLLLYVVIVIGAAGQGSAVRMEVLVEGTSGFFKTVTFTETLFKQFHQCLCSNATKNCSATITRGIHVDVQSIGNTTLSAGQTGSSSLFNCTIYNNPDNVLYCTRSQLCTTTEHSTSYRLSMSVDSCSFSCIEFNWKDPREKLDTTIPGFVEFNQCTDYSSKTAGTSATSTRRTSTTTTAPTTTKATPRTTTVTPTTTAITNIKTEITTTDNIRNRATPETIARTSDDNTGAIVGVVVGVLLAIIIAVIVVVVILRRKRRSAKSNSANHQGLDTIESANSTVNEEIRPYYIRDPMGLPKKWATFENAVQCDKNKDKKAPYSTSPSTSTTARILTSQKAACNDRNTDTDKYYSVAQALDDNSNVNMNNKGKGQISNDHLNKENMRTHDQFGYDQVQKREENVRIPDIQEKQKTANHVEKTFVNNLQNVLEKKNNTSEKNIGQDMAEREYRVNRGDDYDYAMVDNDEHVRQAKQNELNDNKIAAESRDVDYGYSGIDLNQGDTVTNHGEVRNKQNDAVFNDDYEYAENIDPYDAVTTERQEDPTTTHQDGITNDDYNTTEESQYSDLGHITPKSKNVYSKLGDNVKQINNPYNVLFHTKEDPKTRKPLPNPVFSTPATNGESRYSFAHPILEESENAVEIINVDPPANSGRHVTNNTLTQEINNEMSSVDRMIPDYAVVSKKHTTNSPFSNTRPETDKGPRYTLQANDKERPRANAVPDYAVVNKTWTTHEDSHTYFELEKEDDATDSDYDVAKCM